MKFQKQCLGRNDNLVRLLNIMKDKENSLAKKKYVVFVKGQMELSSTSSELFS